MLNNKVILITCGTKVKEFFEYSSDNNSEWLSVDNIQKRLKEIDIVFLG